MCHVFYISEPDLYPGWTWPHQINGTAMAQDFIFLRKMLNSAKYSEYYGNATIAGPDVAGNSGFIREYLSFLLLTLICVVSLVIIKVGNNQETPRFYFTALLLCSSVHLCVFSVSSVPQRCDYIPRQ